MGENHVLQWVWIRIACRRQVLFALRSEPDGAAAPRGGLNDELSKLQSDLSQQLDDAIGSLDKELAGLLPPCAAALPPSPSSSSALLSTKSRPGFQATAAKSLVHPQEVFDLWRPQEYQVQQSKSLVFGSGHVQTNRDYKDRVSKISFFFLGNNPEVNAFATHHDRKDGDKLEDKDADKSDEDTWAAATKLTWKAPAIVFYGGLALAIRLAATALALHVRSSRSQKDSRSLPMLTKTFQDLGRTIISRGKFDLESSENILQETVIPSIREGDEPFVLDAQSYAAAAEMYVVAHEAGHIALSHTLGNSLNYDISRNEEREADSFASSVLSSCRIPDLFLGQVLVTIVFAWQEHVGRNRTPTTHPLGRERFFNALKSNSEAAQKAADDFGLSREKLIEECYRRNPKGHVEC